MKGGHAHTCACCVVVAMQGTPKDYPFFDSHAVLVTEYNHGMLVKALRGSILMTVHVFADMGELEP